MPSRRPGSVTAAGIMAIIYGSLFTLCGVCSVISLAAQGAMGNNLFAGNDPMQAQLQNQLQAALERDVPGYQAFQIGSSIISLGVAVALLIAGIGLLNMGRWARTLALVACLIAIAANLVQGLYQSVYVMPVMNQTLQVAMPAAMPQGGGPQAAQVLKFMQTFMILIAVLTIILYVGIIIYLGIIVILLSRRHVRAAFAAQERPGFEDRPIDEEGRSREYDEEEDWDRPKP
jgi:hypothetical protein